jgi:hypothetical protein
MALDVVVARCRAWVVATTGAGAGSAGVTT